MKKTFAITTALLSTALLPLPYASSSQSSYVKEQKSFSTTIDSVPRGFIPNKGQWDQRALFLSKGFYGNTWVTKEGELWHVLPVKELCTKGGKDCGLKSWVFAEKFLGANKPQNIRAEEELNTKVSYAIGSNPSKHQSDLPVYKYVNFGEIYKGISLKLFTTQRSVEKFFRIEPEADPSQIKVQLLGVKSLRLNSKGELILNTPYGEVVFSKPKAWQEINGKKVDVKVDYRIDNRTKTYHFALGAYDKTKELWIDPILQSTYIGGSGEDRADDNVGGGSPKILAIGSGMVYIAGQTQSDNLPNKVGSHSGGWDVFVSRITLDLRSINRTVYIGGSGDERAHAVVFGPDVYVAGYTSSNNLPNTTDSAQASLRGSQDGFIARLNSNLDLIRTTYLGGSNFDRIYALAIANNSLYVAGDTTSSDFPNVSGGSYPSIAQAGDTDAFVSRLTLDLSQVQQSTYLGGTSTDKAYAIASAPNGDIYVGGETRSNNFRGASGSFAGGTVDGFVTRLSQSLTGLTVSTYLGGSGSDTAFAVAVTQDGDVYVVGKTDSINFPTRNPFQSSMQGPSDAFVSRFNSNLTQLISSTYFGGSGNERANNVLIASGELYVVGSTTSVDLPRAGSGAQAKMAGGEDAFVSRLNLNLSNVPVSTYLGGPAGSSYGFGLALAGSYIYVAGMTSSHAFPNVSGGAQQSYGGGFNDVFVSRITEDLSSTPANTDQSKSGGGCSMTGGASPVSLMAWLLLPAFTIIRRFKRR